MDDLDSYKVSNDNEEASYNVVRTLIEQGYKKLAFIGGPDHLAIFKKRKEGYLKAIKEAELVIPYNFIVSDSLSKEKAFKVAMELLTFKEPPDAFFTVSDHQSLGVLEATESLNIKVPEQVGIFGFANEAFTELIRPSLSSVDQKSKELGRHAANVYFEKILKYKSVKGIKKETSKKDFTKSEVIKSEIIARQSSNRKAVL